VPLALYRARPIPPPTRSPVFRASIARMANGRSCLLTGRRRDERLRNGRDVHHEAALRDEKHDDSDQKDITREKQLVTYSSKITREEGKLEWKT